MWRRNRYGNNVSSDAVYHHATVNIRLSRHLLIRFDPQLRRKKENGRGDGRHYHRHFVPGRTFTCPSAFSGFYYIHHSLHDAGIDGCVLLFPEYGFSACRTVVHLYNIRGGIHASGGACKLSGGDVFPNACRYRPISDKDVFSVLLVILLKLFLKDRLYSLVDGLCGQAVEITVFSWMLGLFILAYVIFSLFFISDPVKKFAVLCVLSLVIFSVFMLALRIVRLAEHKIAMERVLGRQRILEGELEAEKDFFEIARAIRHDQRHHDRIVLEYLESGQIGEAKRYLGAKEDALHADRFMSWCGNPLLDAQLRIAWRSCRQKGIDLDIDVQIPKKPLLNDIDFVSVVGNLVENAIEAASKSASPRIYICSNVSDGYLVMEIENTFSSKVEWGKGMLETTKKEGGIGLRSVKRILARHKGVL